MKKQIHPGAALAVVCVALFLVLFMYYKKTEPPAPVYMSPLGPAAAYLRSHPDAFQKAMTPAERAMIAHGHPLPPPLSVSQGTPMPAGAKTSR